MQRFNREKHEFPVAPILAALGFEFPKGEHREFPCLFHGDRKPSASISPNGFGFTCFACGRTGDAIKLVMDEEGVDYQTAVARCQELTGIRADSSPGKPRTDSLLSFLERYQ